MARNTWSLARSFSCPPHLLACVAFLALLLPADRTSTPPPMGLSARYAIKEIAREDGFRLLEWQASAILTGLIRRTRADIVLSVASDEERRQAVNDYFATAAEVRRLRGVDQTMDPLNAQLLNAEQSRLESIADFAGAALASQIDDYLVEQGISTDLVRPMLGFRFPPLAIDLGTPVFFSFSRLPRLLVASPRDRIEILSTTFLRSDLTEPETVRIEQSVDAVGDVSSVVLPIGGFAAYPSMVPFDTSQLAALQTIAHEWVHHYLALKPLGWQYFDSYQLRSINETVADIAGSEIALAVFRRSGAKQDAAQPEIRRDELAKAMSEIRRSVEAKLSSGDVEGAEQYMAERKYWLASKGYYLRRLNTAYLTFFGAYAHSGNTLEPKLRALREQSGSLANFLRSASTITAERDLDGLSVK